MAEKIDKIKIRMYCLGTGDCFILKFFNGKTEKFTMMIDCGSCQGTPEDFTPYIENLAEYVNHHIDLLIVTHEHNDHVNGFAKCKDIFEDTTFKIDEAWFAWTEDPKDPGGKAKELQKKRQKMRNALDRAINELRNQSDSYSKTSSDDYFKTAVEENNASFLNGLNGLAQVNLADDDAAGGKSLPGMVKIKDILKKKKTKIQYLNPGETKTLEGLPGFKFHVLGPPYEREYIFKDGKQGTDVFKKKLAYYESSLAANAFLNIDNTDIREKDIPFNESHILNDPKPSIISSITKRYETSEADSQSVVSAYNEKEKSWRKIDTDWLNSAGSLALRLNSHINNTSLALAIEANDSEKKVVLFPGDAEYGSWESWHAIKKWKGKGKNGKHFVEDLLNRTVFYKVGHHLSYNGTALEKGILMMESSELAAMATLDRQRISKGWKSTMPNKFLMQELIKRCQGKLFIMDEFEIQNAPSKQLDPTTLGKATYEEGTFANSKVVMYKQFNLQL